jgi:acyl-coenzyme A thioesterase PaaI-like protein
MSLLPGYADCLFCAPDHPHGIRMQMDYRDGMVAADLTVPHLFQGYTDVVHGGIVAGLLDEVMWWVVTVESRRITMTTRIEVEYRDVVRCGMPYTVKGRLTQVRHGTFFGSGEIEDPSGKTIARGNGTFRPARAISLPVLLEKMDLTRVSPQMREILCSLQ